MNLTLERLDGIVGHKLDHGRLLVCESRNADALYRLVASAVFFWDDWAEVLGAIPVQDGVNEHVEVL